MSYVIATPELVLGAAQDLAGIRSSLAEAIATAASPTTGIAAAAQDEVSVAIASMFGNFGHEFQVLSAQARAFHDQFVNVMNAGAGAYLSAEAANAEQALLGGGTGGVAQMLGNLGRQVGGAVMAAESAARQVAGEAGSTLNRAVTAIQSGGATALGSGQIQADMRAVSQAVATAPARLAGQIQTGAQAISQSINGLQTELGALPTGGLPGLTTGLATFGATVAGPYQTLFTTTAANLQSLQSAIAANPQPFLHQFLSNQIGYQQTLATALRSAIQNFPASVQGLLSTDPAAVLQALVNQQIGYSQTISTALHSAAHDFDAGLAALPAAFQTAFQDFAAGNVSGAVGDIATGFGNLFLTGFVAGPIHGGVIPVTPVGTLGDLLPILAIPGQMAQSFTNLLPATSIPGQISQNVTNVINTLTDTSQALNINTSVLHVGLPLVMTLGAIAPAITTVNALGSSVNAFISAAQTGNILGAATALIDAPAVVANGFLNGHGSLTIPAFLTGVEVDTSVPLGGILTPSEFASLSIPLFGLGPFPLSGTAFGGVVPDLFTFLPEQLAEAIGAPVPI